MMKWGILSFILHPLRSLLAVIKPEGRECSSPQASFTAMLALLTLLA